MILPVERLF